MVFFLLQVVCSWGFLVRRPFWISSSVATGLNFCSPGFDFSHFVVTTWCAIFFFISAPVLVLLPGWICCLDLESCAWSSISHSTLPLVSFDLSTAAPVFDVGNRFPVQNAECAGPVSCLCPRSLPCPGQRFHLWVSDFTARAF
jgi:hypothetical protein